MSELVEFYTQPVVPGHEHHSRLLQEIAFLEARLGQLDDGSEGDCAYERALSRTYNALLGLRRQELATLRA